MKRILTAIANITSFSLHAQQTVVQLYNGTAPGSENLKQKEAEFTQFGEWLNVQGFLK